MKKSTSKDELMFPKSFTSPIGFIGLGIMGKGMLKNLITKLDSKNQYMIWNRRTDVSLAIKSEFKENVEICKTPKEVVESCAFTFCMLSTIDASIDVFESKYGVYSGIRPGKVIVDCATLTPERMIEEAKIITAKGGYFLEAPVSGSKVPAENGQLIFLCGGGLPADNGKISMDGADSSIFDLVKPALDAMGKSSLFFGPVGQGSRVKLIVNMMMGTMMGTLSEGLALTEAASLPAEKVLNVIGMSAIANPMFNGKGPNMLKGEFAPNFPLKHAQKDMRFAIDMAKQLDVKLPTAEVANKEYIKALDTCADKDFSAVYTVNRSRGDEDNADKDSAARNDEGKNNSGKKSSISSNEALVVNSNDNIFASLFSKYKSCLAKYPIYTKSLTSCTISVIGEIIASYLKGYIRNEKPKICPKRVSVFGLYGLLCTGPMLHYWYAFLEWYLTKKLQLTGNAKVIAKLLIDRCIWAPPFVLFTITFLQYLQTFCSKTTWEAIKRNYVAVFLMNQKVWVPGQALNFYVVPVDFQVLFVNIVSVGWNTYLGLSQ